MRPPTPHPLIRHPSNRLIFDTTSLIRVIRPPRLRCPKPYFSACKGLTATICVTAQTPGTTQGREHGWPLFSLLFSPPKTGMLGHRVRGLLWQSLPPFVRPDNQVDLSADILLNLVHCSCDIRSSMTNIAPGTIGAQAKTVGRVWLNVIETSLAASAVSTNIDWASSMPVPFPFRAKELIRRIVGKTRVPR